MADLKNDIFKILTSNKDDWRITRCYALHEPTGMQYWIRDGLFFFTQDYGMRVSLGFCNWIKLWFWLKKIRRDKIFGMVNELKK